MKIGLVGPTDQQQSLPFDAERTINLYPVFDQRGKEVSALYGTPGLSSFSTAGAGPVRGDFAAANGRAFVVSNSGLYELTSTGTATLLGTLDTTSGIVSIDENGFQLAICDGASVYIFTYAAVTQHVTNGNFDSDTAWTKGAGWTIAAGVANAAGAISTALSQSSAVSLYAGRSYVVVYTVTVAAGSVTVSIGGTNGTARSSSGTYTETIVAGTSQTIAFTGAGFTGTVDSVSVLPPSFEKVTSANIPVAGTITFIDGYFAVNKVSSGQFNISALYNGFSWGALDFATAESSPDELLRVYNAVGQLWLFGTKTTEIWTNTGASAFPFERISGAKMETGILAPHSTVAVDNSIFWIGRDNIGSGIVYRAQGFSPQRISTNAIELLLQQADTPSTLRAYTYQQDGHTFYLITGGGMDTTLVYDISTQLWHERAYLNSSGAFEQHLGICGMYAFNQQLVGSRLNGKIYTMSSSLYSDDGDEIASERVYTHISDEGRRIRYNQLEIAMETGVGNQSDPGKLPQITLWISNDSGRTYSNGYQTSFGAVGKYLARAVFRRLGIAAQITFKVRITDPVKRVLIGSYLS